jgi:hypothetical protein
MANEFKIEYTMENPMYFDCEHRYFQQGKYYKGRCIVESIQFYTQPNPQTTNVENQVIIKFKDSNKLVGNLTLRTLGNNCDTYLLYDDLERVKEIEKEKNKAFTILDHPDVNDYIIPTINTSSYFERGCGYNKDQEYVTIPEDYYSYFETCVHPILLCRDKLDWWVNLLFKLIKHTQYTDARTSFETATQEVTEEGEEKPLVPIQLRQELNQEITDLLSNPDILKNIYLTFPAPSEEETSAAEESSGGARKCKKQRKKRSRKSRGLRKSKKSKARKSIRKTRSKKRRSKRSN